MTHPLRRQRDERDDAYGARVWAALMADPGFVASLEEGEADLTAGRSYRWEHRPDGSTWSVPNPDWPAEGLRPHGPRLVSRGPRVRSEPVK